MQTSAIGLGLDTTFDDTSVAIMRGKREVLANLTLSQYQDHEEFGGVVPERASRKHLEVINQLMTFALQKAHLDFSRIDYISIFVKTFGINNVKRLSYISRFSFWQTRVIEMSCARLG